MKKTSISALFASLAVFASLVASCVGAGEPQAEDKKYMPALYEFTESGKSGFIDSSGAVMIPAKWDDAYTFNEGLAAVKSGSSWGYIDGTGTLVIECKFAGVGNFCEGRSVASLDGKLWSYIDTRGEFIVKPQWDRAYDFSNGLGQVVLSRLIGFVDKTGTVRIPLKYENAGGFNEGLAEVKDDKGWLFVNTKGKDAFRVDADEVFSFSGGFAEFNKDGLWGYIDAKGKVVISPRYQESFAFKEGLARIKEKDQFGFIDKRGLVVIPASYRQAGNFSNGLAPVRNKQGQWGYIDATGKLLIPCVFDRADSFYGILAYVERGQVFGYIDSSGTFVWKNSEAKDNFADPAVFPVRLPPEGERSETFSYVFPSGIDAATFLGSKDEFTKSLTEFDRQARLASPRLVSDEKFRDFASLQVLDFTDEEKARLEVQLARFTAAFTWKFDWPLAVQFIKTTGYEELGAAYTRGSAVMLPKAMLDQTDEELFKLLAHELCHILLRYNDGLRDDFYEALGYKKILPARLQSYFAVRKITNPDALYYDYAYPEKVDGVEYQFLPLLVHVKDYDISETPEFFDYMIPAYTAVETAGERSNGLWHNDNFVLLPQTFLKSYIARIGKNTEYTIHPEEVLAENFCLLLSGQRKVNKPALLDLLKQTLNRASTRRTSNDK